MTGIRNFEHLQIPGFSVQCVLVDGNTWFRGKDVATILGYQNTGKAIQMHVSTNYKKKLEELGVPNLGTLDANAKNSIFINEPGLYMLIGRSNKPEAQAFMDWVYSEVLPQIRKTGSYSLPGRYSSNSITWDEVRKRAIGSEDALHYSVVKHIHKTYPDAVITPGLGEHQVTEHQRKDSYLKGYEGGQPDIMVTRGLPNGCQDVFAIELKTPKGTGRLDVKQALYHKRLWSQCRIKTIVSSNYDEVVLALEEHYKEVFARAKLPALADVEEKHDFSTNSNPNHWIRKLKNKEALLRECRKRGMTIENAMTESNAKIIEALAATDSNRHHN